MCYLWYNENVSKETLKQQIEQELKKYPNKEYVKKIALFGSFVRGEAKIDSDIDLLVTFDAAAPVGFFEFVRLQQFLESRLGRKVDLVTEQGLSPYFRDSVIRQAELVYGN